MNVFVCVCFSLQIHGYTSREGSLTDALNFVYALLFIVDDGEEYLLTTWYHLTFPAIQWNCWSEIVEIARIYWLFEEKEKRKETYSIHDFDNKEALRLVVAFFTGGFIKFSQSKY